MARVDGVRDLHFAADGALWIASENGLWRQSTEGRLEDRSPSAGARARQMQRVLSARGIYVVTGGTGTFVSADGRKWRSLHYGSASQGAGALALRAVDAAPGSAERPALEIWFASGSEIWRARVSSQAGGVRVRTLVQQPVVGRPPGEIPVDLLVDPPGAELAVVYPRVIALLGRRSPQRGKASGGWEILRPLLPPGARARRLHWAGGRAWLATDRGLLEAPAVWGPWRRSRAPAGRDSIAQVVEVGSSLLAAGRAGLLQGDREPLGPLSPAALHPPDPDILALQRAALAYLGLRTERWRALRRGLRRRGWLPALTLTLGTEYDRSREDEDDQAFLSGEIRHLNDIERERSWEAGAVLSLSWKFGNTAYDPEVIDLSREARQVIGLRDDVLDEINQLYFERLRVRLALIALGDDARAGPEGALLRSRAAELAAGLDAWTGGWFSAQLELPDPQTDLPR